MGLPAAGAAVEGDAAVLRAAGARPAAALLGRLWLHRRRGSHGRGGVRVLVRVRQDPDVRLLLMRARRVGAEEAELGPMLRRRERRAGAGREELSGDELLLVVVLVVVMLVMVRRRRRRGVVVVVRAGRVAVAPEDAELEHGRRRAGAFLRRRGGPGARGRRLRVQHRRLRRPRVARLHRRRRLLRRHLGHVQIQLHLPRLAS